ncbi:MAG: hypothetical protein ACTSXX_02695 [Candidatus Baldrarchaeia archaeon]
MCAKIVVRKIVSNKKTAGTFHMPDKRTIVIKNRQRMGESYVFELGRLENYEIIVTGKAFGLKNTQTNKVVWFPASISRRAKTYIAVQAWFVEKKNILQQLRDAGFEVEVVN